MKKALAREGDVFSIPLRDGRSGVGVLARSAPSGNILLGYFFPYQFEAVPESSELPDLRPEDSIAVLRFSALALRTGEWKIIYRIEPWLEERSKWPMPRFLRKSPIGNLAWIVSYAEDDPSQEIANEPCNNDAQAYEPDGMCGAGFVETVLTKLIQKRESSVQS